MTEHLDSIDWNSLANRLGAQHTAGAYHDPHRLEVPHGAITIHVDTRIFSTTGGPFGPRNSRRFRVRAPYVSVDGFTLHTRRKRWFSRILPSVKTRDETFNTLFRTTSNNADKAKRLLPFASASPGRSSGEPSIMQRLMNEDRLYLKLAEPSVWEDDRWFVEGVRECRFQHTAIASLTERDVVATIEFIRSVLDCLLAMGSARDVDPVRKKH